MNTNLTLPIRQALIGLGPLLATLGWMDEASWSAMANQIATVAGILITLGGIVWQWRVSTAAAKVAQVAALPGVVEVVTTDPKLAAAADEGSRAGKPGP
ncbi:hypothetical protein GCM10019059_31870 [Camelimonas fluminis]|uniref:Holin n=1 Tax=Camelimonas fluminis TaxID=1576911 RepID=A0ABV7UHR6_9HYPH|nr:hypothetical protein [Camelimonas fluminis]GHE69807.1 hypothetical protein GCM10019059_31870 [Camelimonas fluminis]